ncbi:MAG: 3,4-dihydroxy-2-butanone-4-phosphate synthase, partial [Reyranellaceae bacterium]
PVLVRMHAMNIFSDVLGEVRPGRGGEIEQCMRLISQEGRGVIVLIRESLEVVMAERQRREGQPVQPSQPGELRDYGVGAQILLDLGVHNMVLLTNSKKNVVGLEGFGLRIVGQRPIPSLRGAD